MDIPIATGVAGAGVALVGIAMRFVKQDVAHKIALPLVFVGLGMVFWSTYLMTVAPPPVTPSFAVSPVPPADGGSKQSAIQTPSAHKARKGIITVADAKDCPKHYLVLDSNTFEHNGTAIDAPEDAHICLVNNRLKDNKVGMHLRPASH